MTFVNRRVISCLLALSVSVSANAVIPTHSRAQSSETPPIQAPLFSDSCTQENKDALLKAHANMALMLDDAFAGVTTETESEEYRDSFGPSSPDRDWDVFGRLFIMRVGASAITMTADCVPAGQDKTCDMGVWAYVPKQTKDEGAYDHTIKFCPSYFNTTTEEVQRVSLWKKVSVMQGAVFLHELTHFAWSTKEMLQSVGLNPDPDAQDLAGTVDSGYDLASVKRLAKKHPEKAIANADSYHIFVVRLAIRKGTIY